MKVNIIFDGFICPFSDLIDKNLYEVIKTEQEGTWAISKIAKDTELGNQEKTPS
jgi:hypothetical protein